MRYQPVITEYRFIRYNWRGLTGCFELYYIVLIRPLLFVFFPFFAEVVMRCFQHTVTVNYCVIAFCIAFANVVPFLLYPKLKKFWTWFYFCVFYIPTIIDVCHIYLFIGDIDALALKAVFETNFSEAKEFCVNFIDLQLLSFIFALLIISLYLLRCCLTSKINYAYPKIWILIFVVINCASCFVHDKYKPTLLRMTKSYVYYKNEKNFLEKCLESRKSFDYGNITSLYKNDIPQTYVIVIGESANKDHLSLYGYARKTTPKLDSIKDELYVFQNVTSAHCQTLEVLQEALTFDTFANGDVISFFKKAGFKTFWLSNQFNGGRWDNVIAMVGCQADVTYFINQKDTQSTNGQCLDELLIQHFTQAINDKARKKIIFVHLLGSHAVYANRYPAPFNIFHDKTTKARQIISEYDNSIAYTDFILFQLITLLKQKNETSYLLYFSDHGEDVSESPDCTFFHSPSVASPPMFAIPFFIWISEKYQQNNEQFVRHWNTRKTYKTNKLIHSVIELSRLNNYRVNSDFSIFGP